MMILFVVLAIVGVVATVGAWVCWCHESLESDWPPTFIARLGFAIVATVAFTEIVVLGIIAIIMKLTS